VVDDVDVLVAGSGVAGLSAALFASRYGHRTLVVTGDEHGGHLLSVNSVEDFIGFLAPVPGYELCPTIEEQAAEAGATFRPASVSALSVSDSAVLVSLGEHSVSARAVILATGSQLRTLDVPGEAELIGRGVSNCASCDGPLYRGKSVAVVGGGDSAMQETLELVQHVDRVVLLVEGTALHGQHSYVQRILGDARVDVRYGARVGAILGDASVEGVRVRYATTTAPDDVEVSAVFVFVGMRPRAEYLRGLLQLDADDRVPTDSRLRTALRGVLAAGDIRSGSAGQAVTAAGDGVAAAVAAAEYLHRGDWPVEFRPWGIESVR
jgi:thioredoxin reductase (NADPH)